MRSPSLQALVALVRGRKLLKTGGWPALVDALPPRPAELSPPGADIGSIADLCNRAARRLPLATACLERSYAACSVLRRHGVPATFCVGVSRNPPMRFHAWVEVDGQVVNDSQPIHSIYRTMCAL